MINRSLEGRVKPAGYRMIDNLRIANFRCFEAVELKNLRRINLVVGKNGVGKTALLEAIRLASAGTPQNALWLNQVRQLGPAFFAGAITRERFESLWKYFFFGFDSERRIDIGFTASDHQTTSLSIFYDPSQAVTQMPELKNGETPELTRRLISPSVIIPLVFRRASTGIQGDLKATVLPNGQLHLEPGPELGPTTGVLGAIVGYPPSDANTWLNQIIMENRETEFLEMIRNEYPDVQNLVPLTVDGLASVWVTVPYLREKIPLQLLSGGIAKHATLLVASYAYRHGSILVDEVENGTYWDRLPSLWATLHRVSRENDNQIFATTHSEECLEAVLEIVRADEEQFSLIRIRRENGKSIVRQFYGAAVASAIEEGIELR